MGIGGWLILLFIGQIINIFLGVKSIIDYVNLFKSGEISHLMDKGAETYTSSFVALYWTELLGTAVVVFLAILILIAMIGKLQIFRVITVIYLVIASILPFLTAVIVTSIPDWVYGGDSSAVLSNYLSNGLRQLVSLIIWGTYLFKSERVKETFGYYD